MKIRTIALFAGLLVGALALVAVTELKRGETLVQGENKEYTLTLGGTNGQITDSGYSDEAKTLTAATTSGNSCSFTYAGMMKNGNNSNHFGQMRKSSKGVGYLFPTNGISGLKSVKVVYSSEPSAPLLISFSDSYSGTYTDAVNATNNTSISSGGYDFFKLENSSSAAMIQSIEVVYDCSGIDEGGESSSSSSSSSQTSSSSSSSSSASSTQPVGEEGMILFDFGSSTAEATSWDGCYETDGIDVAGIESSGVYGGGDAGARLGTGTKKGTITIAFSDAVEVRGVSVLAQPFGSDASPNLNVAVGETSDTKAITSIDEYTFDVSGKDVTSMTLSTTSVGKRVYVSMIDLLLGPATPIYPTAIELGADFELSEGSAKNLTVSYTPANTNVKNVSFASSAPDVVSVDESGKVTALASSGFATITATAEAESGTVSDTIEVTCTEKDALSKTAIQSTYADYTAHSVYAVDSAPTLGSTKFLIVPIWFTDSGTYVKSTKKDAVREDIRKAYLGTEEETGWHSVKSFYEEESKGKLNVVGEVTDWYECGQASSSFYSANEGGSATVSLVETVTDWYFDNNTSASRKDFDRDGDGYLDGIFLIYASPDSQSYSSAGSNMWAYCYWIQDKTNKNVSYPGPNTFFWASYDFMYGSDALSRAGSSYNNGDTSHCSVDAHTFIHEAGHVFGLEDYYDYGSNRYCPAGGFSMQDFNVGGHDPYSVMAYGWADPYIPTESCQLTIGAFQSTHDLVLLTPNWNSYDSPFDEYLLLELYTPTGLNEMDATYQYKSAYPMGPYSVGVRLWHVDARLAYFYVSGGHLVTDGSHITTNLNQGFYGVTHAFSNSYDSADYGSVLGSSYYQYNLLQLIHASTSVTTPSKIGLSASSLFGDGSSFTMSKYASQFPNSGKLDSNLALGWSFSVAISGSGSNATATLTLNKMA